MSKIQQFKDLAERYGFKVLQDGDAYRLCAKNTDNRWMRWISYYPKKDIVSFMGNTDNLNIWLCDTRKDFTPEKCVQFVEDLNDLFELKGNDKFLVRELIDPEDWQEIAGVPDASEDKRYSPAKDMDVSICKTDSEILSEILSLDVSELNKNGSLDYSMPDKKHHIHIYVESDDMDGGYFYVVEPNRILDGERVRMGTTGIMVEYNNYDELLSACKWCFEQFNNDKNISLEDKISSATSKSQESETINTGKENDFNYIKE